jgi:hypothetical protein
MAGKDYSQYIKKEIFSKSVFKEVTATQFFIGGAKHLDNANFTMGFSYITEPFNMVGDSHKHDFDQIIGFIGGNLNDIKPFGSEIEFGLGEEKSIQLINYTCFVWIPRGLFHGPLRITKVNKPFMFFDITLYPMPSTRPMPKKTP